MKEKRSSRLWQCLKLIKRFFSYFSKMCCYPILGGVPHQNHIAQTVLTRGNNTFLWSVNRNYHSPQNLSLSAVLKRWWTLRARNTDIFDINKCTSSQWIIYTIMFCAKKDSVQYGIVLRNVGILRHFVS